ncbi:MAG: glycosyltransferase [Acidobacteriota bacterium]|nr:glycosyltransferase [Acidobacteriota bacterium]MDQ3419443.1 glycosyltransferase [Acidobacteriota bacterium]
MQESDRHAVGYVVKRYPRYSETFIVNEILAHEETGVRVELFALRPPCDTHFQGEIARVRAPVTYLPGEGIRTTDFWSVLRQAASRMPATWAALKDAEYADARDAWQAAILAQHVLERGIGHLHAHFASAPTTVARMAAHMAGVTYSFTAHAKDIYGPEVRHPDLRRKLAAAAATITVSDFNAEHLRRTYGADADRVTRVYNGLPLDEFVYQDPQPRAPVVVAVGRLVEKKGFADLIDACAILRRGGRPFTCQIIGGGPLEAALREQIGRLDLQAQVHLLGPLPRAEVVRHMQRAAVVAAPCVVSPDGDRDGLPTVLLEAMALGAPCVSTEVTGIPEIVADGVTGLVVPQRNAQRLAAALERLLRDDRLRVRIAAAARAQIERSFDERRNAGHIRDIFRTAASASVPAEVA